MRINDDLHGGAPDDAWPAIPLLDVINDLEYMRRVLKAHARSSAELRLARLARLTECSSPSAREEAPPDRRASRRIERAA